MKQALFQAAPLVTLPLFIVVGAEVNDVFARNVGWTTGRSEHLALHRRFDFARDLYQKLFPNTSWLRVLVGSFEQILASFTVYPFPNRFQQAQLSLLLRTRKSNQTSRIFC